MRSRASVMNLNFNLPGDIPFIYCNISRFIGFEKVEIPSSWGWFCTLSRQVWNIDGTSGTRDWNKGQTDYRAHRRSFGAFGMGWSLARGVFFQVVRGAHTVKPAHGASAGLAPETEAVALLPEHAFDDFFVQNAASTGTRTTIISLSLVSFTR